MRFSDALALMDFADNNELERQIFAPEAGGSVLEARSFDGFPKLFSKKFDSSTLLIT
jgi:hypothetical protein